MIYLLNYYSGRKGGDYMSPRMKRVIATGVSLGAVMLLSSTQLVGAQQNLFPNDVEKLTDVDAFIRGIIRVVFIFATLAVLLFLIYGGFKWVTSGGDKTKTEEARGTITAAIVGLAIIALSFIIVRLLEAFFGINITKGGIINQINEAVR
jgi:tellurite resistance protein TehA-like permease